MFATERNVDLNYRLLTFQAHPKEPSCGAGGQGDMASNPRKQASNLQGRGFMCSGSAFRVLHFRFGFSGQGLARVSGLVLPRLGAPFCHHSLMSEK